MLAIYLALMLTSSTADEIDKTMKYFMNENDSERNANLSGTDYDDLSDYQDLQKYNNSNVSLSTFFSYLLNVSKLQLKALHKNIKRDYQLNTTEIFLIDNAFKNSDWEYEMTLKKYYKRFFSDTSKKTNLSLSDLTDFSHFLLQKTIENNLEMVEEKLVLPTIWSKQSLKQKILRQQMKIGINEIDNRICWDLSLCAKRNVFTDYMVEWLRYLLNADTNLLSDFFKIIPPLIDKYMHVIRTNVIFRQKIKHIVRSNHSDLRDFIDFVDEIFTNQDEIIHIMHSELRKSTIYYLELFRVIDDNYSLNNENLKRLDAVSKLLSDWTNHKNVDIKEILEKIVQNMELNIKVWPIPEQKKIDYIWLQIITF